METISERANRAFDGIPGRRYLDKKQVRPLLENLQRDALAAELTKDIPFADVASKDLSELALTEKQWGKIRANVAVSIVSAIRMELAAQFHQEIMDLRSTVKLLQYQAEEHIAFKDNMARLVQCLGQIQHFPESVNPDQPENYIIGFEVGHQIGFAECVKQIDNLVRRFRRDNRRVIRRRPKWKKSYRTPEPVSPLRRTR